MGILRSNWQAADAEAEEMECLVMGLQGKKADSCVGQSIRAVPEGPPSTPMSGT